MSQSHPLKERNFAFLWLGQTVSELGNSLYTIAYMWWIAQRTESPAIVSTIVLLSMLPGILLGTVAGRVADRYPKKQLLIYGDLLRGIVVLGLTALGYTDRLEASHFFVAAVLMGIITAVFRPAYSATIPLTVSKEMLVRANSLSSMARSVSGVVGPIIGGMLTALITADLAFLLNGLSFLLAAACSLMLTLPEPAAGSEPSKKRFAAGLVESFKVVWRTPAAISGVLLFGLFNLLVTPLIVLMPFLAEKLSAGSTGYGILRTAEGAGILAVSLFFSLSAKKYGQPITMVKVGLVLVSSAVMALGFQGTVAGASAALFLSGIGIGILAVHLNTLIQTESPKEHLGMVFGLRGTLTDSLMPLGLMLSGYLAAFVPLPSLFLVNGLVIAALLVLTRRASGGMVMQRETA